MDIPDRDLRDELLVFMLATGKEREECLPLLEATMKKVGVDPEGKKGLIEKLNESGGGVPPVEEIVTQYLQEPI